MSKDKIDILRNALQWIVDNPVGHPANMVRVAQGALDQYANAVQERRPQDWIAAALDGLFEREGRSMPADMKGALIAQMTLACTGIQGEVDVEPFTRLLTEDTKPERYTVAIYLVDKQYGGPEEGGWWYEAGTRVDAKTDGIEVSPFPENGWSETFYGPLAQDIADSSATALQAHLDAHANQGRPSISSVLSKGRYQALVFEGEAPAFFPQTKPHYE
jgi:hypothetical protein